MSMFLFSPVFIPSVIVTVKNEHFSAWRCLVLHAPQFQWEYFVGKQKDYS